MMNPQNNNPSSTGQRQYVPPLDRATELLSRMTIREKLGQLVGIWVYDLIEADTFSETNASRLLSNGIGQITRIAGGSLLTAVEIASMANKIQRFLVEKTRLGIPAIVHEECCSGYMALGATCYPQMIGLASTWMLELAEAMTSKIRSQMRSAGAHQGLAPVLDVSRDPRWGRVEETFGEDPHLVSRMGTAYIRGLQGTNLHLGVAATGKHFAGHGMAEGGLNCSPVHLGPREFREIFIQPFKFAIQEASLASMMNAYHELDGIPVAASYELLTALLREELGFDGLVVSDYGAVLMLYNFHDLASDKSEAASLALKAGIDVELPSTDCYGQPLLDAVESGSLPMAVVDSAVIRVLAAKFALGLFENPYVDLEAVPVSLDPPEQRALAREIAEKSLVLLKNDANLLPLPKNLRTLAVIGPNANAPRHLVGDYSHLAQYENHLHANPGLQRPEIEQRLKNGSVKIESVLEAVREKVSPQTKVIFAQGCEVTGHSREGFQEAVAAASQADAVLIVVGDKSGLAHDCTCGESRDRAEIRLPGVQEELIMEVSEAGKPVVLVLVNGRPPALSEVVDHAAAIVEAWLPGEEGGAAIANVLFGDVTPGGKLPVTFPRSAGQIPIYYNHKPSGGRSHWQRDYVSMSAKPLFPFGFGLSYTQFDYHDLVLDPPYITLDSRIEVKFTIKNTGEVEGDEVAQLYIRHQGASVTRPVKELKGFQRVDLKPGESKTVQITLTGTDLAFYDLDMNLALDSKRVQVLIGSSSENIHLSGEIEVLPPTTN